jgi:hypothetical protein
LRSEQLVQLCSEGRAFGDEKISRDALGPKHPLASIPKLKEALAHGVVARKAKPPMTVAMVAADLRGSVLQIRTPSGTGSGFAIDAQGTIVTNRHVVQNSTRCTAHFTNGAIAPEVVVFRSARADFAIVSVAMPTMNHVCLSERRGDYAEVGEQVVQVGFPLDAGFNVSVGVISALGVRFDQEEYEEDKRRHEWVRTNADTNGGDSGGPLVDLRGGVVGMATWSSCFRNGRPVAGFHYCVPHSVICREVREYRQLIADGKISIPSPREVVRNATQPDPHEELELAIDLICDQFDMRVVTKVPIPGRPRGFHSARVASSNGDVLQIHVDQFVFREGPPYLTMYCPIGELPQTALQSWKSMGHLLSTNMRLPHWNLALDDSRLTLRYSRELKLLDAVEIVSAVEDLHSILTRIASTDE